MMTQLTRFTARAATVVQQATEAHPPAGTGDLLHAMIDENANLGVRILTAIGVSAAALDLSGAAESASADEPELSAPAVRALQLAVEAAGELGHNYVGCEHLLIGLAAEPDGVAGRALRKAGADPATVRRAAMAAVAGYAHRQSQAAGGDVREAISEALRPVLDRIDTIERRLG